MSGPGAAGYEPIEIILRVHPVSVTSAQLTYEVEIDRVLLLAQGLSKSGYRLPEVSMPQSLGRVFIEDRRDIEAKTPIRSQHSHAGFKRLMSEQG
jgi:hypothetical protein